MTPLPSIPASSVMNTIWDRRTLLGSIGRSPGQGFSVGRARGAATALRTDLYVAGPSLPATRQAKAASIVPPALDWRVAAFVALAETVRVKDT